MSLHATQRHVQRFKASLTVHWFPYRTRLPAQSSCLHDTPQLHPLGCKRIELVWDGPPEARPREAGTSACSVRAHTPAAVPPRQGPDEPERKRRRKTQPPPGALQHTPPERSQAAAAGEGTAIFFPWVSHAIGTCGLHVACMCGALQLVFRTDACMWAAFQHVLIAHRLRSERAADALSPLVQWACATLHLDNDVPDPVPCMAGRGCHGVAHQHCILGTAVVKRRQLSRELQWDT